MNTKQIIDLTKEFDIIYISDDEMEVEIKSSPPNNLVIQHIDHDDADRVLVYNDFFTDSDIEEEKGFHIYFHPEEYNPEQPWIEPLPFDYNLLSMEIDL